jgi:hypothetical protein
VVYVGISEGNVTTYIDEMGFNSELDSTGSG